MEKEIIGAVIALVVGFFIHRSGKKSGEKKATVEGLKEKEDLRNEVADQRMEVELAKPIVDRNADMRDRISDRRKRGN